MSAREETAPAAAPAAAPHVVLICYPSQGNVNPTLRLAKRLAAKGLLVTCCTTSGVGACLVAASSPGAVSAGDGVRVGSRRLRFEFLDDHGNEKDDLKRYLETSAPAAFAELLGRQADAGRQVTCVVGSPFFPWAVYVAVEAGIAAAVLWVQSCAVLSIYYHYARGLVEFPPEDDPDARVTLPGLPPMSVADVPSFLLPSSPYKKIADVLLGHLFNLDKEAMVLVNSFTELEHDVLAALPGVTPRPPQLIPVGPLRARSFLSYSFLSRKASRPGSSCSQFVTCSMLEPIVEDRHRQVLGTGRW